MFITLNPESEVPLFQQIHDRIIEAIAAGILVDGQRLDPVRRVATDFGINPATVKKAYDLLQEDGIIATERRSGSVVTLTGAATEAQTLQTQAELRRTLTRATVQGIDADTLRKMVSDELANLSTFSTRDSNLTRM